jgi:hypothetical protein
MTKSVIHRPREGSIRPLAFRAGKPGCSPAAVRYAQPMTRAAPTSSSIRSRKWIVVALLRAWVKRRSSSHEPLHRYGSRRRAPSHREPSHDEPSRCAPSHGEPSRRAPSHGEPSHRGSSHRSRRAPQLERKRRWGLRRVPDRDYESKTIHGILQNKNVSCRHDRTALPKPR